MEIVGVARERNPKVLAEGTTEKNRGKKKNVFGLVGGGGASKGSKTQGGEGVREGGKAFGRSRRKRKTRRVLVSYQEKKRGGGGPMVQKKKDSWSTSQEKRQCYFPEKRDIKNKIRNTPANMP